MGPKEVFSLNQLRVEIICFFREALPWMLPPLPACSISLGALQLLKGNSDKHKRAMPDMTEE